MERLTKRIDGKAAYQECDGPCGTCDGAMCFDIEPMVDRLAAYEDIGIEPEEIKAIIDSDTKEFSEYDELMPKHRIKELAQAEKEGRLAVLPCSLHQPLYILKNGEIHRNYGCQWHFTDKESQTFGTISMYGEFARLDDFGKTVFLTREEAEAALKKREADNEAD